jgi:WD40 repeat protein
MMNFLRGYFSLFGVLYLGCSVAVCQQTFPFERNHGEIKGAKAAVHLGDKDGGEKPLIRNIAFTPDSRYLVALSEKALTVWDVRNRKKEPAWALDEDPTSFALTPDGKTVAVTSRMAITLYDFQTRKKIRSVAVPESVRGDEDALQVVFNEDGTLMAAATGVYGTRAKPSGSIHVWELADKGEKLRHSVKNVLNYQMRPPVIAFIPGKKQLLSSGGGYGGEFGESVAESSLIDLESGKSTPIASYDGKPAKVGRRFAVARDGGLWVLGETVWASGNHVPVGRFTPKADLGVFALTFCPMGRYLAALGATNDEGNYNLLVWDVVRPDDGVLFKERVWVRKLPGPPQAIAFSPDGASLAVATTKGILVWDARALLPVTDPVLLNEDLLREIGKLREQVQSLERRVKELESKK